MNIITAGSSYLDIDAYAGIIAYAELLQKQGHDAQAVSTAMPNESVTKTVRSWPVSLQTKYISSGDDTFTLIDISTPEYFDTFVDLDRVEKVIDHHPGYEAYWQEKIGNGTNIEPIGAACTQVYEGWQKAGLVAGMSETSARLLMCGILDNTLNFGAKISTKRDEEAYKDLARIANLPADWPAQYFGECQEAIDKGPVRAIQKDTKIVRFPSLEKDVHVGQFAVWSATDILGTFQNALQEHFMAKEQPWFINVISIGERKSYFLCNDVEMQKWLSNLLNITFSNSLAIADRLWLRKEIIKAAINDAGATT
jgi:inorganic pyrophosphatase/exopolyphosphatase